MKCSWFHAYPIVASIRYASRKKENMSISDLSPEQAFKTVSESLVSQKDHSAINLMSRVYRSNSGT